MGRRRTSEEHEGRTGSWFGRVRGRSSEPTEQHEGRSGSLIGRARAKYGLGALLVVAGLALFLFPEPITSTAGIALIAAGVLIWVVGWLR